MSDFARIYTPFGDLKNAKNATTRTVPYYCRFDGCNARMTLVSMGTDKAHFRSCSIQEHAFSYCIKDNISFHSDQYNENLFNFDTLKNHILKEKNINIHNSSSHSSTPSTIGNNQLRPIRTLGTFYAACLSRGINRYYGDVYINDILACSENYDENKAGFSGFKLVELTYYHKVKDELAFIFNYPTYNSKYKTHVKVTFTDPKDFWQIFNHFKNISKPYLEPIVIAADWNFSNSPEYSCEAIVRQSSQHVFMSKI